MILILLLIAGVGLGCSPPCSLNADCPDGTVCNAGVCGSPIVEGEGEEGEEGEGEEGEGEEGEGEEGEGEEGEGEEGEGEEGEGEEGEDEEGEGEVGEGEGEGEGEIAPGPRIVRAAFVAGGGISTNGTVVLRGALLSTEPTRAASGPRFLMRAVIR
jgi:hypothetical protein